MPPRAYTVRAPSELYRVSFGPDGTALRDWSAADVVDRLGIRTFGHRYDDPAGEFRSLYTSASAVGAFIERFQDLRPDPEELARLVNVQLEPGEEMPVLDMLPQEVFDRLYLVTLVVDGESSGLFLDILNAEAITTLRARFGDLARQFGDEFSAGTILGPIREVTQAIARYVYERQYAGILAASSLGLPHTNWTIFEDGRETNRFRASLTIARTEQLSFANPDFIEALHVLHIRVLDPTRSLLRYETRELDDSAQANESGERH